MTSVSSFSLFSFPSAASPFPALQNTGSAGRSLEWRGWQQGAEEQEYLRDRLRPLPFITLLSLPTSTLPPPPERQSEIKWKRKICQRFFSFKKEVYLSYSLIKCPSRLCLLKFFFSFFFNFWSLTLRFLSTPYRPYGSAAATLNKYLAWSVTTSL